MLYFGSPYLLTWSSPVFLLEGTALRTAKNCIFWLVANSPGHNPSAQYPPEHNPSCRTKYSSSLQNLFFTSLECCDYGSLLIRHIAFRMSGILCADYFDTTDKNGLA